MALTKDAQAALLEWSCKQEEVTRYNNYMMGEHDLGDWATARFRKKYGWALRAACTNYCPAVVSAFTDGLEIASFRGSEPVSETLKEEVERVYAMARREAWATGDGFIVVKNHPVTGEPKPLFQKSSTMVAIVDEDDPGKVLYAAKIWYSEDWHIQLIYADRVERFVSYSALNKHKGVLSPTRIWEALEPEATYWDDVPVIWMKLDAPSQYDGGVSVLNPVMPIQDRYNKGVADAIVGSEGSVAPVRYFLVDEVEDDLDGADEPNLEDLFRHKRSDGLTLDFDDARQSIALSTARSAGQFAGPVMEGVLKLQEQTLKDLVGVVRLTPWFMSATAPQNISAETATILSAGLRGRQQAFIRDNRPALKGLMELMGVDATPIFAVEAVAESLTEEATEA